MPLGAGDGSDFEGRTKPPEFEMSFISTSVSELSQPSLKVPLHHKVSIVVIESNVMLRVFHSSCQPN